MVDLSVERGGVTLAGEEAGEGPAVVLLHGLTATRRYVVMGSRALERGGHRVIAYDARGHGASSPAPEYGYEALAADLLAVLDERGIERAVLVGASMGAHTIVRFALDHGDRAAGLVVVTPAYVPEGSTEDLGRWDALAAGLRSDGVDGFVAAYGEPPVPEAWRETIAKVLRQRLSAHEHPAAVVASRDEADPGHPYAIGERYAAAIPGAELRSEEPGASPLAWQGGQLSKVIADLAGRV